MSTRIFAGFALALFASAASASTTITFSTDAAGNVLAPLTTIGEQYAAIGVHFVGSAFDEPDNPDDNFASNTDMRLTTAGGDVPLFPNIPVGAGNFLHTYSGFTQENGDNNFAIVFDTPVTSVSIDIYDDVAGLTQMFAIEGEDILDATQSADTEDAPPQTLTVSAPGGFTVVGIILGSNIDWVAADNITFASVPEPVSILSLSSIAMTTRRRRRRVP
jgi:hypothetical protein